MNLAMHEIIRSAAEIGKHGANQLKVAAQLDGQRRCKVGREMEHWAKCQGCSDPCLTV